MRIGDCPQYFLEDNQSIDRRLFILYFGDCPIKKIKQKDFVLEKGSWTERSWRFFTLGICMYEGISEDSGLGHDWSHLIHDMQAFRCVIM